MTPHPICHTMVLLKYSYLIRPKMHFTTLHSNAISPFFVWSSQSQIIKGRMNMLHMRFPLKWFPQTQFSYHRLASGGIHDS